MLSFLILVTLLIKNKVNKGKTRTGEGPPLMSVPVGGLAPSGQASSQAQSPHYGAKVAVHATPPPDRHSPPPKPAASDARTPNSRIVLKPAETFRVAMADNPVAAPARKVHEAQPLRPPGGSRRDAPAARHAPRGPPVRARAESAQAGDPADGLEPGQGLLGPNSE